MAEETEETQEVPETQNEVEATQDDEVEDPPLPAPEDDPDNEGAEPSPKLKVKKGHLKKPAASAAAVMESKAKGGGKGGKAKATPKAKADMAKAKAKVSVKAPPPPPPSPVLKRPASSMVTPKMKPPPKQPPVLKKPATSKASGLAGAFQVDMEEEHEEGEEEEPEEDQNAEDEEEGDLDARNRCKSRKFWQMLKAGSIPMAAQNAWKACSTRSDQTRLINTLFEKKNGQYVLKQDYFVPESYQLKKETQKSEKALDESAGYGRLLFCKRNGLSDQELEQALKSGEVRCWTHGDMKLYSAVNVTYQSEALKRTTEKLDGHEVYLDGESGGAFCQIFDAMDPQVNSSGPASSGLLADDRSPQAPLPFCIMFSVYLSVCSCYQPVSFVHACWAF